MAQNTPRSRRTVTYSRAAGLRILLCAFVVVIGASVGWSQPVPDTILLPDSLGPLRPGYHLAFGSSTDNIYVASESSDIIVVDGSHGGTFQRIKRLNTGTPVGGVLLVSQHNRLYCSYPMQGRIGVIDCATNNVVGSIQVGTRPTLLCYSSGSDKLYCGDTIDRTVSVIDCATNEILKVIPVGDRLAAMEYDPTTSKVYAGTRDALLAISCSTDSIVATISAVREARALCINKRRQKLYVAVPSNVGHDTVFVISTQTDSVAARMLGLGFIELVLACNEVTDRLYGVAEGSDILEFDCIRDTLVRTAFVDNYLTTVGLACDSVRNRLYYLYERDALGYLLVLDCETFDVISKTYVGVYPALLQADPARYRMMCIGWSTGAAALTMFDYKGDSTYPSGGAPLCGWVGNMCHNPATGKLYYWWGLGVGGVGVIDEQTNRVIAQAFLSKVNLSQVTYSRTSNKFYFHALTQGLGVIDGWRDSLLRVIPMGSAVWGPRPCWCPDGNKVYCAARAGLRSYIAVVDCDADSVAGEIDVYRSVEWFEYLGEGRILCVQNGGLSLIDTRTDSILVDTTIEESDPYAAAHAGDGEKVYLLNGRLWVLSSSSLALLGRIRWPYGEYTGGGFLRYASATRRLYWFTGSGKDSVVAIDVTSDTVVARTKTSASPEGACLDHTGRYLFCASPYDTTLSVHDTQTDSLVALYSHLPHPVSVVASPEQQCIYVGCRDAMLVYPDAPPGVEEAMNDEREAMNVLSTIVRGVLMMEDRGRKTEDRAELLDVSGRKVMGLRAGANDVSRICTGVYFIREGRAQDRAMRKVILTR